MKRIKEFYTKHKQIILYFLFGVITTVASLGAWYLTIKIGVLFSADENGDPTMLVDIIGSTVQWVVGVVVAFVTNKKWVFVEADKGVRVTMRQFAVFTGSRVLTYFMEVIMNLGMIFALEAIYKFFSWQPFELFGFLVDERMWAKGITAVVVVIANYVISKKLVFKKRDKKKKPKKAKTVK